MSKDIWPLVHTERQALIADLEGLTEAQWAQPALCPGWTVHDVVAHLVDVAESTRLGFARDMVRAGFDFDRQNERGIARAKAVCAALARYGARGKLVAQSAGESSPRATNATVAGRALNRRVELSVSYR